MESPAARPPSPARPLASRRFLIVTGKGGVGKSTVSAALAVALAREGKRVLVALCNAKEKLSRMLGTAPLGSAVSPLVPGVWGVNIDPDVALFEYGQVILKSKTLTSLVFDSKLVKGFLRGVPGMQEWATLGKAWWHTTETLDDGRPRFDVVILDAPATGHGLDMLRVPKVILDVVPPGLLRRDAERAMEMFRDPTQSGVVLVTLPEDLPVTETLELAAALEGDLRVPVAKLVVNQMLPPLFSRDERGALADVAVDLASTDAGDVLVAAGRRRARREQLQAESLARLTAQVSVQPSFLPLLFDDAARPEAIKELSHRVL